MECLNSEFFFSFHTTRRHSNKAVQQAVSLIATYTNDKNS